MPEYQTPEQRKERYDILAEAYGEKCVICWCEEHIRRGPPRKKLIIEHIDNNRKNWSWYNIYLCCYSHNKKKGSQTSEAVIKKIRGNIDQIKREREREGLPTLESVLKNRLNYDKASIEIQLSRRYHKRWLRRLHQIIKGEGSALRRRVIADCGNYAGCKKQTSENYYFMATAGTESPFEEKLDDDGEKVIVYRNSGSPERKGKR